MRRSGDRVRITAQVIDASTGHHIWAETFDRQLDDVFAVQDEISTAIAAATQGTLQRREVEWAGRQEPENLDAWDLVLRARWRLSLANAGNREDAETAEDLVRRALALDPDLAIAHSTLSLVYYRNIVEAWVEPSIVRACVESAQRAIELDPQDAYGYLALMYAGSLSDDRRAFSQAARQAAKLNPSLPLALAAVGLNVALEEGRFDDGKALIDRAIQISPTGPDYYDVIDIQAVVRIAAGEYEDAETTVRSMIQGRPNSAWPRFYLATILWHQQRLGAAQRAFDAARELGPEVTLSVVRRGFSFLVPQARDVYLEPLEAMGLPAG